MTTIVTRSGKGSPLTNTEVDTNFTNLNTAKIETLTSTDSSVTITGTGSSRDLSVPVNPNVVSGPASATNNAVALFDGTTGKLIKNSVVTVDGSGNEAGILSQQFGNGSAVTLAPGKQWYDGTTGAWNLGMGGGNITQQVGEELFVYGKASAAISGNTIVQAIYQTGVVGSSGAITFAPTVSGITNGDQIIGVATEDIALSGFGRVTSFGVIHGVNTTGSTYGETWASGDTLWYNPVTGGVTNVKPVAPNLKVQLGIVINAGSGGSGSLQVEINHGSVLGGTDSNVQLTSPSNGNILTYDGGNGYWKNTDLTAGTGISVSKSANGVLTVANTGVTSVTGTSPVVSSGGATPAISLASGYGDTQNPYVSKTQNYVLAAPSSGAGLPVFRALVSGDIPSLSYVSSVGVSAPLSSTGGLTPTLSIPAANGTTNGYLSSTDWTTFNNKQPAGAYLTAVTSNAPLSGSGTSGSPLSIPAANGTTNGYLTSTDWTTFNNKLSTAVTSATAGTGISVSASTGAVTFTNTAPDQTVALTAGTGISVTGTYPNFTIANTAGGATISDDTTTNATRYPLYAAATSGTASTVYTSSSKYTYNPSTGTLSATVMSASSDERLKTNWKNLPVDFINNLSQVKYGIFDRTDFNKTDVGVGAQSLQQVLPQAVIEGVDGYLSVNYGGAALVAAIELAKEVKELRAELAALKAKVDK